MTRGVDSGAAACIQRDLAYGTYKKEEGI